MNFPAELKYSRDHEWVKMLDETTALVGITDFAQSELGDLVYVNLPEPGDEVLAGETACDVESVKAVSDVMSPVTGVIAEVNEELDDSPELLNSDPYEAWIMKIERITDFSVRRNMRRLRRRNTDGHICPDDSCGTGADAADDRCFIRRRTVPGCAAADVSGWISESAAREE